MHRAAKLLLLSFLLAAQGLAAADTDFFEKRVRPVLAHDCYGCHGPDKQFAGLRLDTRAAILTGGKSGPAAVPGSPGASLLIKAVRHEGLKMPLGGKLKAEDVAALEQWVKSGMDWPAGNVPVATTGKATYEKFIREHWAFQPVRAKEPPGSGNPVDRFIASALQKARLTPAAPASKLVLARRAAYVLTGLPPSPDHVRAFLNDSSPNAYAAYVDKLMASPHFGERWARHWMDLVRFAETYGYEWNYEITGAWRYRDYLIRAFNEDVPYDQLIREHIAGDLLPNPRLRDALNESVLGTMFFRLGEMGHDDCIEFRELRTDVVDNQIDTLTKTFQGLTVSCSRCHDHKIDPIPTEDYYALYGIINSTRPVTHTLETADPNAGRRAAVLDLKAKIRRETADAWLNETSDLHAYLQAAIAWHKDSAEALDAASGLDSRRVNTWVKLLSRENTDLDDPLYPLAQSVAWSDLASRYAKETEAREKDNREKFVPFADFRKGVASGWNSDGLALRNGPAHSGDFAVATHGGAIVSGIFPAGLFSNLLSDRLDGVVRSPILPKDKKFISLQVAGDKLGAYRKIVDHCVIGEDHKLIASPSPTWVKLTTAGGATSSGLETVSGQLPFYVELSTIADNPRFPERPDKFKGVTDETLVSGRSYFGIIRAVLHDADETPKSELHHMARLFEGDGAPAARFARSVNSALTAWRDGAATDDDVVWIDWLIRNGILSNSRNLTPALHELTDSYRALEAQLKTASIADGMADIDHGEDAPIFNGGSASSLGRPAPRHFLSLMPPALRTVGLEHSGRRELAEAIASPDNPLTARVMVNRIWSYVFGRGLAGTTDNFGRYGEPPTNPELLDYLAARFVREGWSVKKMVRLLVTSSTFQQGNQPASAAAQADPENKLWHHYPVRRLDAESVRDRILAVSGRLDESLYGPSIDPHRGEPKAMRRLFQGPLDGNGRRSIYIKVTRMEGPRFLEIFDFPLPMQTRGNRDITNVPAQALALLNDPFVLDQARFWAERVIKRREDIVDTRMASMFEAAAGHPPSAAELHRWRQLLADIAQQHKVNGSDLLRSLPVWKDIAHSLFCMKEFLYVR